MLFNTRLCVHLTANFEERFLVCLTRESREGVDEIVRKVVAAGGTTYSEPHDHGFMYGHGFQNLDGYIWELISMAPAAH
jgi:uncharacterized protein